MAKWKPRKGDEIEESVLKRLKKAVRKRYPEYEVRVERNVGDPTDSGDGDITLYGVGAKNKSDSLFGEIVSEVTAILEQLGLRLLTGEVLRRGDVLVDFVKPKLAGKVGRWLYHVTNRDNLKAIRKLGIRSGRASLDKRKMFREHVRGRIFFSDSLAQADEWVYMLGASHYDAVILKIDGNAVEGPIYFDDFHPDGSYYIIAKSIPPKAIKEVIVPEMPDDYGEPIARDDKIFPETDAVTVVPKKSKVISTENSVAISFDTVEGDVRKVDDDFPIAPDEKEVKTKSRNRYVVRLSRAPKVKRFMLEVKFGKGDKAKFNIVVNRRRKTLLNTKRDRMLRNMRHYLKPRLSRDFYMSLHRKVKDVGMGVSLSNSFDPSEIGVFRIGKRTLDEFFELLEEKV